VSVLTATHWKTNGEMIADVATLGYLDGLVLDVTPGKAEAFWTIWRPDDLTISHSDFRHLPFDACSFDAVVFDPPYKLNGTPSEPDARYGVDVPATRQERHILMGHGLLECLRVSRRFVLMKCMDQVEGGRKRWQTDDFSALAKLFDWHLVDKFQLLREPRPQPGDRRQVHSLANHSTLLILGRKP